MKSKTRLAQFIIPILFLFVINSNAQTVSFTYQGRLTDTGAAANGSYDFRFSLFDASGNQIGATQTLLSTMVINGVFTVQLDFGANAFPGAERFLEIAVKQPNETNYTVLSPRQRVTSSPYSIKSFNADTAINSTQLGGITANQFVQTNDTRLSDDRNPLAGSNNYIQNTLSQQTSANFNIGGTGTANIINAATQFNLGGSRVLFAAGTNTMLGLNTGSGGTGNSFFGFLAGTNLTSGFSNSFFGNNAGRSNTTAAGNSFFGHYAGFSTTTSGFNSFFGQEAGYSNTAVANSFFGYRSGYSTTTGSGNVFFGFQAGESNTLGGSNTFLGYRAGRNNQNSANTFIGWDAGFSNTTGNRNVFVGDSAGRNTTNGAFNTIVGSAAGDENIGGFNSFFGANSGASNRSSRNAFFGVNSGMNNTDGADNAFFGGDVGLDNTIGSQNAFFGSKAGFSNTTGEANSFFGSFAGSSNQTGGGNAYFGKNAGRSNNGSANTFIGVNAGEITSTGALNTFVGLSAGDYFISGDGNTFIGSRSGSNVNISGNNYNTLIGSFTLVSSNLSYATAVGSGAEVSTNNTIVLGRINGSDKVVIYGLGISGSTSLCRNTSNQISTCSSSLRYKTNVNFFNPGLNLVKRLQPITFDWKDGGMKDLGLGAETVAEIEPLLVTYNKDGEVEGVKYDRLGVVLLNAVKEQQTQIESQEKQNQDLKEKIESQQKQIEEQKTLIEGLRSLVCAQNPQAQICQPKEERRDEK